MVYLLQYTIQELQFGIAGIVAAIDLNEASASGQVCSLIGILVSSLHRLLNDHTVCSFLILLLFALLLGAVFVRKWVRSRDVISAENVGQPNISPGDEVCSIEDYGSTTAPVSLRAQLLQKLFLEALKGQREVAQSLHKLQVNPQVLSNPDLGVKIDEIVHLSDKKLKPEKYAFFTQAEFCSITGLTLQQAKIFSRSEQLLMMLISIDAENETISALMGISRDNVRARKHKLKHKLMSHSVPIPSSHIRPN